MSQEEQMNNKTIFYFILLYSTDINLKPRNCYVYLKHNFNFLNNNSAIKCSISTQFLMVMKAYNRKLKLHVKSRKRT